MKILKKIKMKLNKNNVIITIFTKGNSTAIFKTQHYNVKFTNFTNVTKFTMINTDPTNTLQITIRKIINSSKSLVQEEHKWKYFSLPLPSYYKRHYQNPQT